MKANELRIGNWVMYNDQNTEPMPRPVKIIVTDLILIYEGVKECVYAPIPLTPEILVKCGFSGHLYKPQYIGKDVPSEGMTTDFVLTKPLYMGEWQDFYAFGYDDFRFTKIEHLHQLQNLYFALTGTELEVNL